jgi:hypothetical protein
MKDVGGYSELRVEGILYNGNDLISVWKHHFVILAEPVNHQPYNNKYAAKVTLDVDLIADTRYQLCSRRNKSGQPSSR